MTSRFARNLGIFITKGCLSFFFFLIKRDEIAISIQLLRMIASSYISFIRLMYVHGFDVFHVAE